jgi:translin
MTKKNGSEGLLGSMKGVETALLDQLERRETLLKDSRDVIACCSRAIINVHNRKMAEATAELAKARKLLGSLKKVSEGPVSRYLVSPEAEFVEASTVCALVRGDAVPSRDALEASAEAYVLGLLDSVGELKRLVLDSIMHGEKEKSRGYFEMMEILYSTCSPIAAYDHVVNGVRRKIDVARMLVEDTRGLLVQEIGRQELDYSLKKLSKRLGRKE